MNDIDLPSSPSRAPLLVIASNRGPFSFTARKEGGFSAKRGAGGLVPALAALAEKHDVLWIAAALSRGGHLWAYHHGETAQDVQGTYLQLIRTQSKKQYEQYYNEISNPLLWFIQHQLWDASRSPSITRETWNAWNSGYVAVNRLFAEAIARS